MPDNIQKYPYRPFPQPVPPIPILGQGEMCITFDRKYLKYIIGALKALEAPQTYESDQEQSVFAARELVKTFIVHDSDCENTCIEFPLSSAIIGWEPKNPFTEAGEIPDGYIAPPFYLLEDDAVTGTLGLMPNDVISGWFSLPVLTPALGEGLARFRVTVEGPCTVELHLLTIPAGGVAWVVDDDNVLTLTSVDLNRDLVSLPPETGVTVIQEREFITAGEHHIDVSFLVKFDDTVGILGYGGGVRKVVVCGGDNLMLDVRQNPDERCILQKRNGNGDWEQFADLSLCAVPLPPSQTPKQWRVVGGVTQYSDDGVTFYDFPDGSESEFGQRDSIFPDGLDNACIAARNIVATLRGQFMQIRDALAVGAAVIGVLALITAAVLVFVTAGAAAPLALALVAEVYAVGAVGIDERMTSQFWDDVECIIYTTIGGDGIFSANEFANFYDQVLALGDGGTMLSALLSIYGLVGVNNMVLGANITTCDSEPCSDELIREFNFLEGPQGFQACLKEFQEVGLPSTQGATYVAPASQWIAGLGWVEFATRAVNGGGFAWSSQIKLMLSKQITLTRVDIEYDFRHGAITEGITTNPARIMAWSSDRNQLLSNNIGPSYSAAVNGINTGSVIFASPVVIPIGGEFKAAIWLLESVGYGPPYTGYGRIRKIKFYGSE